MKPLFITCAVIAAVIFFYFYTAPLCPKIWPHNLTLASARNYYTILSSWIAFIVGLGGLFLGYFYYFHKINVDAETADKERKRKRLGDLMSKLDEIDDLLDVIFNFSFSDERELKLIRSKIIRKFDVVILMLDQEISTKLLGLDTGDIREIIKIYSFVDTSYVLMTAKYGVLNEKSVLSEKSYYNDIISTARKTCLTKLC